ncbi:hypothetical protein O988_00321 [Pseudogymnoascus sp. VKM F-3808]|nr:hypothetical protein O988_00321 [Pseudogymnoascus sp. VKM F-3808]
MSQERYSHKHDLAPQRQTACHSTSSAFSSSANPDENWKQVSAPAERRRIQNRIAQRNYRKKLKRRLENLERRASSSSASPPQICTKLKQNARKESSSSPFQASDNLDCGHSNTSPRSSYAQYFPSNDSSFFTPYTPRYDNACMTLAEPAVEPKRRNDSNAFSMSYAVMAGLDDPLMPPLCPAFVLDVIGNEHYAQAERGSWPSPPL